MSPGTAPRARIALSLTLPLILIMGITMLRSAGDTMAPPTVDGPQFLTWSGDPHGDGLNHYIVQFAAATADADGWLSRDSDGLLSVDTPDTSKTSVDLDELDALLKDDSVRIISTADVAALIAALSGVTEVRPIGFDLVAVAGTVEAVDLAGIPGVVNVDRDAALTAATVDEYYPSQWALENDGDSPETWVLSDDADVDAPEGWHRTRGAGVVVAVLDSGIDITHPDLAANIWHNSGETCGNGIDDEGNGYVDDCYGWDFAAQDPGVEDLNGHGTHVAGIIAAEANNGIGIAGVAYESKVMALKIGDQTPALSSAIEAIAYAIDNGARIINASWLVDDPAAASFLEPALDAAAAAGVLVVTGAGNDGNDIDVHPVYPGSSSNPNVITVGASNGQDLPAAYSGFGDDNVDLFAPGEHIVSTLPGSTYGAYSGTSMATPMVSGAAALLWAASPQASAAEVKAALLDRSDGPNDGVSSFRDLAVSDGRLNIGRAIYSRLFRPSLMITFHDFNSFEPQARHRVTIQAQTVDPWIAHPQTPSRYRAGLYVPLDGQPMAVVGNEILHTMNGAEATAITDGTGRALVGDVFEPEERSQLVQDGDFTDLHMELPAGTYAFVMEIVDVTNPDAPVRQGDPSAVFFIVGTDGSVTEMPGTAIGGGPGSSPPGGTVTTTAVPGDPAPSTTLPPADDGGGTTDGSDGATTTMVPVGPETTTTIAGSDGSGSGGDAPTTTTAPDEDEPATSSTTTTTTTAAPEDGGGGSPTTTLPADEPPGATTTTTTTTVAPDGMRITDVDPTSGPTTGSTLVTITGVDMPLDPEVWFGTNKASIVAVAAPTFIVVESPAGAPGPVDVRVVDRASGDEAVYVGGFLYTDDSTGNATTTTTVPASTTLAPGDAPTTTAGDAVTTTVADAPDAGPGLEEWLDGVLVTPDGLTLAPVAGDDPFGSIPATAWAGALCDESVCPGWVIEE